MKKWFRKCPFCANEIKEWAKKCQYCHKFLNKKEEKKECPFCMNEIDIDAITCSFCGENLEEKAVEKKSSTKNVSKEEILNSKSDGSNELTKANNNIKTAFIVWCIWGWITLVMTLAQQNWWLLLWLAYFWTLLYFLYYKKNRMAALFLFIEYIMDTIYSFMNWGAIWLLWILILAWLFLGVLWTFSYHKIMDETKLSTWEIIILVIGCLLTLLEIIWVFSS